MLLLPRCRRALWKAFVSTGFSLGVASCISAQDMPQFIAGACTHFGQGKGILSENLSLLKQMGFRSSRDDLYWGACETQKNVLKIPAAYTEYLNAAKANEISPLTVLCYGNQFYDEGAYPKSPEAIAGFVNYAANAAKELKGKCRLFQIWNEWDGGCGMAKYRGKGDPESYVKLLSAVYPAVKAANPEAIVIANSICTGDKAFQKTLEAGVLKHCDAAALHTYNYSEGKSSPEDWLQRMEGVRRIIHTYNDNKDFPLYITEMGWPNQIGSGGRTAEETGDYIVRLYLLAKTMPFIKGIWWYDFQNDGWTYKYNEDNFGLIKADLTPKAPYYAIKDIAPLLEDAEFIENIASPDENVRGLKFKLKNGQDMLAFWSTAKNDDWQVTLNTEKEISDKFELLIPGKGKTIRAFAARDWTASRRAKLDTKSFQVSVNGRPAILIGKLPDVKIAGVERKIFPESLRPGKRLIVVPEQIGRAFKLDSKDAVKTYNLGADSDYRQIIKGRTGKADIDASFSMRWAKDRLILNVLIQDDQHCQNFDCEDTWQGDGIQFAIQIFGKAPGELLLHSDFDAALTKNGPYIYRQNSQITAFPKGEAKDIDAKIIRENNKTNYEITIPAKSLGINEFKTPFTFGFSLLVNDNDGDGRKGYLHWGDGIGVSKDPSLYNWISLED